MPIVEINGRDVEIQGDFATLPPEQQQAIVDDIANHMPPAVGTAEDIVKSVVSGAARGVADLVGLPGSLDDALRAGLGYLGRKGFEAVTGREPQFSSGGIESFFSKGPEGANRQSALSGNAMRRYLAYATGGASDYKPQTTAGKYVSTVGEFLPGAAAFGGLNPANIARFGVVPGLASEAAGQATEGTKYEPWARTGAALLAPMAANRLITPFKGSGAERAKLVKVMEKEGVPLSAGQKLGNTKLLYKESQLAPNAAADFAENQGNAFTRAVLKRIGVDADAATPQVLGQAADDIGRKFETLTGAYKIPRDPQLFKDLQNARLRYMRDASPMSRSGTLDAAIKDVTEAVKKTGSISGRQYQSLRSEISKVMRSANPETTKALRDFINAMDDGMERAIRITNPSDVGAFKEARNLWKNLLVVERAATGAGEAARLGIISPKQLRSAAMNVSGRKNFARGKGDFAELARAGEATMVKMQQSGTTPRFDAMLPFGISGTAGTVLGATLFPANPVLGGIAGASLGAAAPKVLGNMALSGLGRKYLGNQALPPLPLNDPRLLGPALLSVGRETNQ